MQTTQCATCGLAAGRNDTMCEDCRNSLDRSTQSIANVIPMRRVVLMTAASGGLYFVFWFYLTWKQYRDHTARRAFPFWHAMTLSVPIYGLFRIHGHMRDYAELLRGRDVPSTINPKLAVAIMFAGNVLSVVTWLMNLQDHLSQGQAAVALTLAIIQTAITIWLLTGIQRDLNRYWTSTSTSVSRARVGAGEIVLAVLGLMSWSLMLAAVASESFRAL